MEEDWQTNLTNLKCRGQYLLQSEKLADCRFLVGTSSNQRLIAGHRILLAMASPVFERMFYGSLPEKNDPIGIPDVQPDAFKAMLDYIYTDEISISSFDTACGIYYAAKKYMLPHLVKNCFMFLLADQSPKNACRAYEFAKLNDEPRLMERSMKIITTRTQQVMSAGSFMDIEVSTMMDILDQNRLSIDSEWELYNGLLEYAKRNSPTLNEGDKDNTTDMGNENSSDVVVVEKMKLESEDSSAGPGSISAEACDNTASGNAGESTGDVSDLMNVRHNTMDEATLRQAIKKIRFLAMSPKQFTEGPIRSKILNQNEAYPILVKISNPSFKDIPMPEGFSQSRRRDHSSSAHHNRYCISAKNCLNNRYYNSSKDVSSLRFVVDRNIYLLSILMKLRDIDFRDESENFYVSIHNNEGSKIAFATFIENKISSRFEFCLKGPLCIQRHQMYEIKIMNHSGDDVLLFSWDEEMHCEGVKFSILNASPHAIGLDSIIKGMIFTI